MGDVLELDAVWRRYAETAPQLIVVEGDDLRRGAAVAPHSGVELTSRSASDVVAAVRRALPVPFWCCES